MSKPEPKLKPAGAGLPFIERNLLRHVYVPMALNCISWERARRRFMAETEKSLAVYQSIPPELHGEKILIKRLGGLEDSSRYWSADMTLEHMILVAKGMVNVIATLDKEQYLVFDVRIAAFKPKESHTTSLAAQFISAMQDCADKLAKVSNHHSIATHIHPWFGKMNTHGWHTLLAMHQKIHRQQLELIRAGLGK